MQYVGRVFSTVTEFYKEINPATLSGAIDIIVVEHPDGHCACSPFHVRFGKLQVLRPQDKVVEITVNGEPVDFAMKVGEAGEAFFVLETENPVPHEYATSPIAGPSPDVGGQPEFLDLRLHSQEFDEGDENGNGYVSATSGNGSQFGDADHSDSDDGNTPVTATTSTPHSQSIPPSRRKSLRSSLQSSNRVSLIDGVSATDLEAKLQEIPNGKGSREKLLEDGKGIPGSAHHGTDAGKGGNLVRRDPGASEMLGMKTVMEDLSEYSENEGEEQKAESSTGQVPVAKPRFLRPDSVASAMGLKTVRPPESYRDHRGERSASGTIKEESKDISEEPTGDKRADEQSVDDKQRRRQEAEDYHKEMRSSDVALKRTISDDDKPTMSDVEVSASTTKRSINLPEALEIPRLASVARLQEGHGITTGSANEIAVLPKSAPPLDTPDGVDIRNHSRTGSMPSDVMIGKSDILGGELKKRDPRILSSDEKYYEGPFSDTELDHSNFLSVKNQQQAERAAPLSDTEIDYPVPKSKTGREEWSWGWGSLPVKHEEGGATETVQSKESSKSIAEESEPVPANEGVLIGDKMWKLDMSLCGVAEFGKCEEKNAELFHENYITYETFCENPRILSDPSLVFRFEGRYLNYAAATALMTSLFLYQKPPPDSAMQPPSTRPSSDRRRYGFGGGWRHWWSRSSVSTTGSPPTSSSSTGPPTSSQWSSQLLPQETSPPNFGVRRQTMPTLGGKTGSNESVSDSELSTVETAEEYESSENVAKIPEKVAPKELGTKNYAKTLRLTSGQLKSLNLQYGVNTITFSVSRTYQGKATCAAKIFLWKHDTRIVISDIDGTITKSDALGHLFNIVGKDWTHAGVAKLYTDIVNNNYQILYLTSRAIGQADSTREYLKKVEQDNYQLPDGPVIMSPDRLLTAFHREVIMRRPELFKMACLRDVAKLFGNRNPFYAGFGNRITDALSYRSVDVPASRIFTIDSNGEVKLELLTGYRSSYIKLGDLVHLIFPPIASTEAAKIDDDFNDWNYWKQPVPKVELPDTSYVADEPYGGALTKRTSMLGSLKSGIQRTASMSSRTSSAVFAESEPPNLSAGNPTIVNSRTGGGGSSGGSVGGAVVGRGGKSQLSSSAVKESSRQADDEDEYDSSEEEEEEGDHGEEKDEDPEYDDGERDESDYAHDDDPIDDDGDREESDVNNDT